MHSLANRYRWSAGALVALVLVAVPRVAAPVRAQQRERIRGIVAGPFIVAPSLTMDFEADSNLLNVPSSVPDTSDVFASAGLGFEARLPFGQNLAEFEYHGAQVSYDKAVFESGVRQEGFLGVRLNFRSGDQLRITDAFLRDFSQVAETSIPGYDPGADPETKYFGSPYQYNRLNIEMARSEPDRVGYRIRIGRRDFFYEDGTFASQYDYQGWDNDFEYYQPFSSNRSIVLHYGMVRLNDFRDSQGFFRKEVSDSLEAGLSGVGGVRPFYFRVGYTRFFYEYPEGEEGNDAEDYRGLSGYARWMLPFGGRSSLALSLARRPLPSSYDTFYINDQFRIIAEQGVRPRVRVALLGGLRQNRYADEIPVLTCDGLRQDWTWDAGFRAAWALHPLMEVQLAGNHEQRRSNCNGLDYESTSVNVGMRLGWF